MPDLVSKHRDLFVGVNLAGRRDGRGHALRFIDVFRRMRTRYSAIPLSLHAGKRHQGTQVRDTLLLEPTESVTAQTCCRIPGRCCSCEGNRYLIETSLLSKPAAQVRSRHQVHPFPQFLRIGIPICLNTDDRGAWDSNMTDEVFAAVINFNLSWKKSSPSVAAASAFRLPSCPSASACSENTPQSKRFRATVYRRRLGRKTPSRQRLQVRLRATQTRHHRLTRWFPFGGQVRTQPQSRHPIRRCDRCRCSGFRDARQI